MTRLARLLPISRHEELLVFRDRPWKHLGRVLSPDDFTNAQAVAAIEHVTRGNVRLA